MSGVILEARAGENCKRRERTYSCRDEVGWGSGVEKEGGRRGCKLMDRDALTSRDLGGTPCSSGGTRTPLCRSNTNCAPAILCVVGWSQPLRPGGFVLRLGIGIDVQGVCKG